LVLTALLATIGIDIAHTHRLTIELFTRQSHLGYRCRTIKRFERGDKNSLLMYRW
jgi:hypothetical protein